MLDQPLIHIGYHKTGSTWLQRRIFADQSLGYTLVQPRTIVDEAFVVCNPFTFDPRQARAHFEDFAIQAEESGRTLVISHERLTGLPLMNAVDARPIADRIAATFPLGKVLLVIREQRSMMVSLYKQYVRARMGSDRYEQLWRERTVRERRRPGPDLEVFEYHHLIRYYQELFGRDRVLVLPFEMLCRDAKTFVAKIMEFAGQPGPAEVSSERENAALSSAAVEVTRLLNIVFRRIGIESIFAGPIADRRARRIRLVVLRSLGPLLPHPISDRVEEGWRRETLRLVAGRFAESNVITQELTGIDLASYGYDVGALRSKGTPDERRPGAG